MGKPTVYIDGQVGTTGLQIRERLARRDDIELLSIADALRHDTTERARLLNTADLVFLCLPDAAAREAVTLIENPETRVIDASTAHRTAPGWVYGFPELDRGLRREAIARATRVANPGCHATGFIACVAPLVEERLLVPDATVPCFSVTGYTGGGRSMIEAYEAPARAAALSAPRLYGLSLAHKHLPEMRAQCGLDVAPLFVPVVADYPRGMATSVLLTRDLLRRRVTAADVRCVLAQYFAGEPLVTVSPEPDGGMLAGNELAGSDALVLHVNGEDDQVLVTALFDNLGKGASGAAVQSMNLILGLGETCGLAV